MPSRAALGHDPQGFVEDVLAWFDEAARDLPWREPSTTPWGVLVSEVMLQQTPVTRVVPAYEAWIQRWPNPASLASDSPGEAVRMWGRLGYPRRALRLHSSASACVERHEGRIPDDLDDLRALPGVGDYTAAAVAAFAYGQRCAVLDTNVRRVHARAFDGSEHPVTSSVTVAERARATELLPHDATSAARLSVAVMELGALVCTARSPNCVACPLRASCRWLLAGRPAWSGAPRKGQTYDGTDRQCRGRLLGVLRAASKPVDRVALEAVWPDAVQRERALDSLVADGLVEPLARNRFALPR
jgi:A/G-specific adenine glycosylase